MVALPLDAVTDGSTTLEHDGEGPQETVPAKHLGKIPFGAYVPLTVVGHLLLFKIFDRGLVLEKELEMELRKHCDEHTQNHSDDEDQN